MAIDYGAANTFAQSYDPSDSSVYDNLDVAGKRAYLAQLENYKNAKASLNMPLYSSSKDVNSALQARADDVRAALNASTGYGADGMIAPGRVNMNYTPASASNVREAMDEIRAAANALTGNYGRALLQGASMFNPIAAGAEGVLTATDVLDALGNRAFGQKKMNQARDAATRYDQGYDDDVLLNINR